MKGIATIIFCIAGLLAFSQDNKHDSIPRQVQKDQPGFVSLLTGNVLIGKSFQGWGINYTGYGYNPHEKFFMGISLGYEGTKWINDDPGLNIKMGAGQVGFRFMGKLSRLVYVNIGLMGQVGRETVEKTSKIPTGFISSSLTSVQKNMVFGFAPSEGIFFVPGKKGNVTVGLSFYQRIFNSEYYRNDIGGMFSLGFRF